jgi:hypothetical protein
MADEDSNPKEAKSVPKLAWTAALKDKLGGAAAETPSAGRDGRLFFVETKDFFWIVFLYLTPADNDVWRF